MKLSHIAAAFAMVTCTTPAYSQSAGSFLLSTGWLHFSPRDSSEPFHINTPGNPSSPVPNTGFTVSDADTIGLAGTYFITDNIASELAIGIPPRFNIKGTGIAENYGTLGSVRQWSPTLLLKYYFLNAETKLRPYVGLGVSRVWFNHARITSSALSTPEAPASLSVDSRWAAVFNGGFTYQFDSHWFAGLSVSYMPLRTATTVQVDKVTPAGRDPLLTIKTNIKLNPIITYLNVGYRF